MWVVEDIGNWQGEFLVLLKRTKDSTMCKSGGGLDIYRDWKRDAD